MLDQREMRMHSIVGLDAILNLMCSLSMSDTSPSLFFPTSLRMWCIRWKSWGWKYNIWAVIPSKLFASFVLFHLGYSLQWNTLQLKLCWISVYIRCCNIRSHSENTFAGNNSITFLFCGTFLLSSCVSLYTKPINFWGGFPSTMMSGFIKIILWNSAGKKGQSQCWNSL